MAKASIREFQQCDRKGKRAGVYVRVSHEDVKRVKESDRENLVKQSILTQAGTVIKKAYSSLATDCQSINCINFAMI